MTPKEKALDLINKFENYSFMDIDRVSAFESAKQCALIACNEILSYMGADRGYQFWTEVKIEIQKL